MKITYVLNSGNYGGMEWHVIFLVEGMVKKGYEVFVWCPDGAIVEELENVGAKVTKRSVGFDLDPFYISSLAKFLKENEVSVVHAHELKAGVNAMIAGTLAGVKVRVSHTHTPISEWQISKLKRTLNKLVYSFAVNMFSLFEIALTPSREKVKRGEGIKKTKLHVIKNANAVKVENFVIDSDLKKAYRKEIFERHSIAHDAFVWGCVGRTSEEKGHKILLNAFKSFYDLLTEEEKRKQYLLIVGGGPLEDYLRGKIREYGLSGHAIVTGRFTPEDQIKYFSSIDMFIHPSLAEGFGIVLVEAMVAGIPVLASALEVFKEVGSDTISFFKRGDEKDLSVKMKESLNNINQVHSLAKKAQKRAVSLFSFENFVNAYEEFYLDLLRVN